jgi:Ca-activated chloride channel family protein
LLTVLPMLAVLAAVAWFQRRRAWTQLGFIQRVPGKIQRRWGATCVTAGLVLLVLGIAGPQWGRRPVRAEELAPGRDLVVVLDLSRSMLAEQPSRQERALAALVDLADALQARGGHRIALVVFAAHARLVFPLTTDYDHFRDALTHQNADNLPRALRPQAGDLAASGTRIGEALRTAVMAHDPANKGVQDILLVSDGDDPAGDEEWSAGVDMARAQGIPVYTVGIGDPVTPSTIPSGKGPLLHNGKPVTTRLEEQPLEEIARRTHGHYLPAHTNAVPLGKWWRSTIASGAGRQPADAPEALPLQKPRYAWFFAGALGCFAVGVLVSAWKSRGPSRVRPLPANEKEQP